MILTSSQLSYFRIAFSDQLEGNGMIEYNVDHYQYRPLYFELGDTRTQLVFTITLPIQYKKGGYRIDCYFHEESINKFLMDFKPIPGVFGYELNKNLARYQFRPEITAKVKNWLKRR